MTRTMIPALFLAAFTIACDGGDKSATDTEEPTASDTEDTEDTEVSDTDSSDTESETETAYVRLAHLSPDAPAVDIFVNDPATPALEGVSFGDNTDFIALPAGNLDVWISASGASSADAVLALEGLTIAADGYYTAAAVGELAEITAVLLDQANDDLASGQLRLNVAHAAPAAPEVDVWELSSGTMIIEDFKVGEAASLDVPEGPLSLGFDIDNDTIVDVTFDVPALGADVTVDVFAVSDPDGNVFLWALDPTSSAASVNAEVYVPEDAGLRALHLVPDAPAVDIYLDEDTSPAVSGAAYLDGTDYLVVPAGFHDVYVTATGAAKADAVLVVEDLFLSEGGNFSAVAIGELASIQAVALQESVAGLADGELRLQVTHAAPGVSQVDVWDLDSGTMIIEDFAFGDTASLDVPEGALNLGVDVNDDASPDVTFSVPSLGSNDVINVFANNNTAGDVFLVAHLPDGTVATVSAD